MPDGDPIGLSVIVTRPRGQATALIDALEARGADVIACPVLEIVARNDNEIEAEIAALDPADIGPV